MQKIFGLISAIALAAVAWMFFQNFEIEGLKGLKVAPREKDAGVDSGPLAVGDPNRVIRVAAFNIKAFGQSKIKKPHIMERLARIIRHFDVVAIQEIRSIQQDVAPRLIEYVNAGGRKYDYVIGPRLGRSNSKEQFAFVFDTKRIEVDRHQLYTVEDDRRDLIHREPLVGWFRVRGPKPDEAFTFSLVNVHTDPDEAEKELSVMERVLDGVRNDGRNEDDVILLGDFNASAKKIAQALPRTGLVAAITDKATNTLGTKQYDNLLFDSVATREYMGRSGVFDFLREFNLEMDQAQEISDHLPVWAEFSIYEGGEPGRVAARPGETR